VTQCGPKGVNNLLKNHRIQNTERSHSHKVAEIISTHFSNAIVLKNAQQQQRRTTMKLLCSLCQKVSFPRALSLGTLFPVLFTGYMRYHIVHLFVLVCVSGWQSGGEAGATTIKNNIE